MEEEVCKNDVIDSDSALEKKEAKLNLSSSGKDDQKDENRTREDDEQYDSTCESILSSINEECNKISREKENGVDDNIEDSSDGIQQSTDKEQNDSNFKESSENGDSQNVNNMEVDEPNDLVINEEDDLCSKPASVTKSDDEEGTENQNGHNLKDEENKEEDTKNKAKTGLKISSALFNKGTSDDDSNDKGGNVKIKLRSFASLCGGEIEMNGSDSQNSKNFDENTNDMVFSSEISGVAVGDIVQHSNIIESDESGVMHLKISNVVGGEDCITGLAADDDRDSLLPIQITSVSSLIEPLSPETECGKETRDVSVDSQQWQVESSIVNSAGLNNLLNNEDSKVIPSATQLETNDSSLVKPVINIFRSPLIVEHNCNICEKKAKCDFRIVLRGPTETVSFICSEKCKSSALSNLVANYKIQKPRIYFEHICGMCGKEMTNSENVYSWQTRQFCNKSCLADHIGEVARVCFLCKNSVRVLYMVKYCVRFGSDVHQFCSNTCLESFKSNIQVCSFCQKNLTDLDTVYSPSNKEYCSNKCMKRAQRKDIGQLNYKEERECTVCCKKSINKYEFIYGEAATWLCSDPCLNVFKYAKQVISVNCCLCARLINAEDSCNYFFTAKQLRVFCTESCFSVYVISSRKIVTCSYCKVKKYNFDMICSGSDIYSCSVCCLNFIENQNNKNMSLMPSNQVAPLDKQDGAPVKPVTDIDSVLETSSTATTTNVPVTKQCSLCYKIEPAQFHMVMSDSTLRSFCSYLCATRYKCTFGFQVSGGLQTQPLEKPDHVPAKDFLNANKKNSKLIKTLNRNDHRVISEVLSMIQPPEMVNKSTYCEPNMTSKEVQCETDSLSGANFDEVKAVLPIPIPTYVPTPMMMYSAPTPVPIIIPVPVPIPVFIPTTEKTSQDLEQRIKSILDKMPSNPAEAELIMLANQQAKGKLSEESVEPPSPVEDVPTHTDDLSLAEIDEENDIDMIARIQNLLPKSNITENLPDNSEDVSIEVSRKRKAKESEEDDDDDAPSSKKSKYEEQQHLDLSYGVSVWKAWVKRRTSKDPDPNLKETELLLDELSNMSSSSLDYCLRIFLSDLRDQEDSNFDVDTIFYLLLGIQKHIFEQGSTNCIFLEVNFEKFISAFDDMINNFYSRALPDAVNSKRLLGTRVTEEMLWEARQLGAHTPHVLLNTLFYFNTKVFRLKKAEQHFNLTFKHIYKEWRRAKVASVTVNSTALLKYSTSNYDNDGEEIIYEMVENKDNPLRCPVKLYEFYLSKCPESVRNQTLTYYVYPEQSCLPDSPVWFSTSALQMDTIEQMLNRVLLVREVQEALYKDD